MLWFYGGPGDPDFRKSLLLVKTYFGLFNLFCYRVKKTRYSMIYSEF